MYRILLILIIFYHSSAIAQHSSLLFKGPTQAEYNLYLDGEAVDSLYSSSMFIDSLTVGEHTIDVQLIDSSNTFLRALLYAYPNVQYHMELAHGEQGWEIRQTELLSGQDNASNTVIEPSSGESRQIDTIVLTSNEKQCETPITPQELQKVITQLKAVYFETERAQVLSDLFESSCFTVAQIKELIRLIDDEAKRLKLVQEAYEHCFDPAHYESLSSSFLLDMYASKFHNWLSSKN